MDLKILVRRFDMKRIKISINFLLFLIILTCVPIFYNCNSGGETRHQDQIKLEPFTLNLKWLIYSSFSSHFVALEKGYFKNEGLDVKILPGGPGVDPIKLVATDAVDVGLAGYEQILIAREKGIPIIAIGEDYVRSGVGFFSLKSSNIKNPQDFIGKKVGILPGSDKYTLYCAMMSKLNIDRKKITEIPSSADLVLLFSRTVDVFPGFLVNQPFVAEEKGFQLNIIDPFDYGIRPGGNVYFTSEKTFKTKRAQLKAFLIGALKGIIEAPKLPDEEVVNMVLKYNDKLNKNAEIKIWRATKKLLLEKDPNKVGLMYESKWNYTANMSKEYGLINRIPDLKSCYTNTIVQEILSEDKLK